MSSDLSDIFTSTAKKIGKGFFISNRRYLIPPYQRPYTWTRDQWNDFYNDLITGDEHFLGMLVFMKLGSEKQYHSDRTTYYIVDGQQRFSTLSILYLAFYRYLYDKVGCQYVNEKEAYEKIIKENMDNPSLVPNLLLEFNANKEPYKELQKNILSHIFIDSAHPHPDKRYLELSKCKENDDDFIGLCKKCIPEFPQFEGAEIDGRRLIYKAYDYFYKRLEKSNATIEDIQGYVDTIDEKWEAVELTVDENYNSCQLFDSLNNRGDPLSPVDIIKNKLFTELLKYSRSSSDFDRYDERWKNMTDAYTPALLQRYFMDYYNVFELPVNSSRKAITENELIKTYSSLIKNDATSLLEHLESHAVDYRKIVAPRSLEKRISDKYRNNLFGLNAISAQPANSLLLYLYTEWKLSSDGDKKAAEFRDVVDFLGKYFIRRHLTEMPVVRGLSDVFVDLVADYRETGIPEKGKDICRDILEKTLDHKLLLSNREDVVSKIAELNYTSSRDQERIRYLFAQYELKYNKNHGRGLFGAFWEKGHFQKSEGSHKTVYRYKYSIEHVFPRGDKSGDIPKEWVSMLKDKDIDNRIDFVDKLGNLTLLLQEENASVKQSGFINESEVGEAAGKQHFIASLNRKIDEDIVSSNVTKWTEDEIQLRTDALAEKMADLLDFMYPDIIEY